MSAIPRSDLSKTSQSNSSNWISNHKGEILCGVGAVSIIALGILIGAKPSLFQLTRSISWVPFAGALVIGSGLAGVGIYIAQAKKRAAVVPSKVESDPALPSLPVIRVSEDEMQKIIALPKDPEGFQKGLALMKTTTKVWYVFLIALKLGQAFTEEFNKQEPYRIYCRDSSESVNLPFYYKRVLEIDSVNLQEHNHSINSLKTFLWQMYSDHDSVTLAKICKNK